MRIEKLPFSEIPNFSKTDIAYQCADKALRPFYKYPVEKDIFSQVIRDKSTEEIDRDLLYDVISDHYKRLSIQEPAILKRIREPRAYTVITAHQPVLFTGPLYFVYKIASAINLAKALNSELDETIIPLFITGGEDHDLEEMDHLHLFGKRIAWQPGQTGPVGRMSLDGMQETADTLFDILGTSANAEALKEMIRESMSDTATYADMMIKFVHALFKGTDLVILNMDDARLKRGFAGIMEQELLEHVSQEIVTRTQRKLEEAGFSTQAYVRETNLFYLLDQQRNRIEFNDGKYHILDTDLTFSVDEMTGELKNHPERFSPNVIMRPLFQEKMIPNLAYIGGGGELAYWLDRKEQFEHFGINFPMLIRRNSALWMNQGACKQMRGFELGIRDLFIDIETLVKSWVDRHTAVDLEVDEERALIEKAYEMLEQKSKTIDPTLSKKVGAEGVRHVKQFDQLGGRLMRAQKQKFEQTISKLRKFKEKLFPGGGLQERHDNFMPYYLQSGPAFLETLINDLDPLQKEFLVFLEEN